MALNLKEDQVNRLKQLLDDAKQRGEELCRSMHGDLENVVGSEWVGQASNAGQISSADMLSFWQSKLAPILDKLVVGITGTQNVLNNQDSDDKSAINAVAANMHYGRL
ncbi:hypothetical protein [Amycolatopsis thermophila]|uniref:WXG100 family type VII secretion target n=1 Tax=Amycolatopsis thermophila TaxID=206084 RepID=A0ABU0EM73_9PSEU|nr:hypothetical protein [Amycolatopsis thermophila]MDQ0376146.1 hypothetical protein [Amycolatopsis thermophila]